MQQREKLFHLFQQSSGVVIDSRKVKHNTIFFALQGENTDGNLFAEAAIELGALCVVTDKAEYKRSEKYFLVDDVLIALQNLARDYRDTFTIPFIGLTGSNGKTTSKELIHSVLATKFQCFATQGNLNNHLGVPLSILSIPKETEIAVIEMGANHQKEIEFLCTISKPTHGYITNIGKAHLEGFGGIEGVKKGKSELYQYLQMHNGIIFLHSNNTKLFDVVEGYDNVEWCGYRAEDKTRGKNITSGKFAALEIDGIVIQSQLVGDYNCDNILAAACIGKYFSVTLDNIKNAIENYHPENNRSQWQQIGKNYFYLDAYNANPSSMQAAVLHFAKMSVHPKILILGDMLELGEYSQMEHAEMVKIALQNAFQQIITIGPEFKNVLQSGVLHFDNSAQAKEWFDAQKFENSYFLIKGSRGIKLEKIIS